MNDLKAECERRVAELEEECERLRTLAEEASKQKSRADELEKERNVLRAQIDDNAKQLAKIAELEHVAKAVIPLGEAKAQDRLQEKAQSEERMCENLKCEQSRAQRDEEIRELGQKCRQLEAQGE